MRDGEDCGQDLSEAIDAELALLEGASGPAEEAIIPLAPCRPLDGDVGLVGSLAPSCDFLAPALRRGRVAPPRELVGQAEEPAPEPERPPEDDAPLVHPAAAAPGTYPFVLTRFLTLFSQRYGIETRLSGGEAVLKLPEDDASPIRQALELRMPLSEEGQLDACLSRRLDVIDPGPLVGACLGRGRLVSLRSGPLIPEGLAREVLGCDAVEVVHVPLVELNFLVTLRYYRKEERVVSLVYALDDGIPVNEASMVLEPQLWTREGVESLDAAPSSPALVRIHGHACATVEKLLAERRQVVQREIDQETREAIRILDDYYDEKAKELEDEKRSVYFHLYYFEKEEAIDKQLAGMKREKEEQARALQGFWDVRTSTTLLSLGCFAVPFFRPARSGPGPWLDGLVGRLVRNGGAFHRMGD